MTDALPRPVARLLDAANANDLDAFLDAFVDGGIVDDWGRELVAMGSTGRATSVSYSTATASRG
jgi:hypothetical protein